MNFKNLKKKNREPKVLRLLPNVCDFYKNIHLGKDLNKKSIENILRIFILCDFHLKP